MTPDVIAVRDDRGHVEMNAFSRWGFIVYVGVWGFRFFQPARFRCGVSGQALGWCGGLELLAQSTVWPPLAGTGMDGGAEPKTRGRVCAAARNHCSLTGACEKSHFHGLYLSLIWLPAHVPLRWWEVHRQSFLEFPGPSEGRLRSWGPVQCYAAGAAPLDTRRLSCP